MAKASKKLSDIIWEGDSKDVLSSFPKGVKQDLGLALYLLQLSEKPPDWKPMVTVGKGVFELRAQDDRAWYRVIYFTKIKDKVFILHCFEKKREQRQKEILIRRRLDSKHCYRGKNEKTKCH